MKFICKHFDELSARELYEIIRARTEVFLLEQGIVCQDLDRVDYDSLHCFLESDGEIAAYLRAYTDEEGVKVGRVLTTTHGVGLGRRLMESATPKIIEKFNCDTITLHAQTQARGFYEKLGYTVTSAEFLEEGVPHVTMKIKLKKA